LHVLIATEKIIENDVDKYCGMINDFIKGLLLVMAPRRHAISVIDRKAGIL
jgi:hypothetical protein